MRVIWARFVCGMDAKECDEMEIDESFGVVAMNGISPAILTEAHCEIDDL